MMETTLVFGGGQIGVQILAMGSWPNHLTSWPQFLHLIL